MLITCGTASVKLFNYEHCGDLFNKSPDGSLEINYLMKVRKSGPVFVMEVGYRHENFDLLMREAEVYLNGYTNIEYCLLIDISFERKIPVMRIILCRRRHPHQNFKNIKEKKEYRMEKIELKKFLVWPKKDSSGKDAPEKFKKYCDLFPTRPTPILKAYDKSREELEETNSLVIVEYITLRRGEIQDAVTLPLDLN